MTRKARIWIAAAIGALSIAIVGGTGVTVLGAMDWGPPWAVDFDTALVEHLPEQLAPMLYRLLGQGQFHDIHAPTVTPHAMAAGRPPAWCHAPALPSSNGTLEHVVVRSSALNGALRDLYVYLPPSYFQQAAQCWRYPVVYLLDGWPGSAADWFTSAHAEQTADRLIHAKDIPEVMLVSADGNGGLHQEPTWANAADGSVEDETFLVRDVVGYIDHHFRTWSDAQHRAIAGLSDGGFGAANLGLRHPDVFSRGMALSGFFVAPARWPFGSDPRYRRMYSPLDYISDPAVEMSARSQRWFLGAGTTDGIYYQQTRALDAAFTQLQIPHRTWYWVGGHSWIGWGDALAYALPYFSQNWP